MKKLALMIVVLSILPAAIFAQLGFGAAAFYKSPVLLGQPLDLNNHNVDQFSFGADLRLKLGLFQAEGLALYSAGTVSSFSTYLDAGLGIDIAILRFSLGAGPNFIANFGATKPVQAGFNAKAGVDLQIGKMSVGLSYLMALNIANGADVNTSFGLLGAQILFWM
jgi:hypothetical protein